MPVSLFPYSSDTWFYNGGSYEADDGSVLIPGQYQYTWPTVIIRSQDVEFTRTSLSPESDFLAVMATLNKQVPGTCTFRFSPVGDPATVIKRTSRTIAPTEVTKYSSDNESSCGIALFHSDIPSLGKYTYDITFRDNSGYIVANTSGITEVR